MQEDFQNLIVLLKLNEYKYKIISELLDYYLKTELTYTTFDIESSANNKQNLLDIYELRGKMENVTSKDQFVIGYDKLLPSLKTTPHNSICISTITTDKGSYIIFTDFNKLDFIGILKSKRTLTEIRANNKIYKEKMEQLDNQITYDSDEIIFLNGKMIE